MPYLNFKNLLFKIQKLFFNKGSLSPDSFRKCGSQHTDTGNVVINVLPSFSENSGIPGSLPNPVVCEDSEFTFVIKHFFHSGNNAVITAPVLAVWLSFIETDHASTRYGVPSNEDVGVHNMTLRFDDVDNNPDELRYLNQQSRDGILKLNVTQLSFNDLFTQDDIDSGNVLYVHSGVHDGRTVFRN